MTRGSHTRGARLFFALLPFFALLALPAAHGVLVGGASAQPAPAASPCGEGNEACRCSFECCLREKCSGPICNQCVVACLQPATPSNAQFTALKEQCKTMVTRGYRRL